MDEEDDPFHVHLHGAVQLHGALGEHDERRRKASVGD